MGRYKKFLILIIFLFLLFSSEFCFAKGADYVLLNIKNGTYHKTDCKYGQMAREKKLIRKPRFRYHPASCCYPELNKTKESKAVSSVDKKEEELLLKKLENQQISLFFVNPVKVKAPQNRCINDVGRSLITLIDNSKETIDMAVYGFQGQDDIINALRRARERGVRVRGVVDDNTYKFYFDTHKIEKEFGLKEDVFVPIAVKKQDTAFTREVSGLMHNKFFIIDNQYIWTGSTNITDSCMTMNANDSIVIISKDLANIYTKEFNQMFEQEKFHTLKEPSANNEKIPINYKTSVSVYFSPKDDPVQKGVIPLIQQTDKTIKIMMFYFTNKKIVAELINAHNRGVNIQIIVDYEPTAENYSAIDALREVGIPVKVENWKGKMHTKTAVFDDKVCVIGSTNWTSTAEYVNDENMLVIDNADIATQITNEFKRLWKAIPDKYLKEKAPSKLFKEQ